MKKFLATIAFAIIAGAFALKAQDNVTVLLESDFTQFTTGTEEKPASLTTTGINAITPGYYLASSVSAANGKLYVSPSGYLQLSAFSSLSYSQSTVRITVEVKMLDSYGGACQVTNGGYGTSAVTTNMLVENDNWTTMSCYLSGVTYSTKIKILPFLSVNGFYIKSLKVEYSPDFIAAPEAYIPNNFDGTQFTASCSRVSGASTYEADVYSIDATGNPVYAAQNVALTALSTYTLPSAKITGLTPGVEYYYVARAVTSSGAKSDDSNPVKLVLCISSIDAPVATAATAVTDNGYTANWNGVENALFYVVNTYSKETLGQEQSIAVFEEDFSGVNVGDMTSIEFSGNLNDYTKVPGWTTDFSKAYAAGYFVIYPTSSTGTVTTPVIDLSAAKGACTVTINAAVIFAGAPKSTNDVLTVSLVDENSTVIETAQNKTLDNSDFADYTFSFTKGTANSRIEVTYTKENSSDLNRLFIDELTVSQTMPAGTVVNKQLASNATDDATTSLAITLTPQEGKTYSYQVIAVGETVAGSNASAQIVEIQSPLSNAVVIPFTTGGIDQVTTASQPVAWKAAHGTIAYNGTSIAVYNAAGQLIATSTGTNIVDVPATGLVIAVVDGTAVKIAL